MGSPFVMQQSQLTSLSDPNNSRNASDNRGDSFPGDAFGKRNVAIDSKLLVLQKVSYGIPMRLSLRRNHESES